jgi:hypothetical protein
MQWNLLYNFISLTNADMVKTRRAIIAHNTHHSMHVIGGKTAKMWRLDFEPDDSKYLSKPMNWVGSADPMAAENPLDFPTKEDAIRLCKQNGWPYLVTSFLYDYFKRYEVLDDVEQAKKSTIDPDTKPVSNYADNFKYKPPERPIEL